MPSWSEIRDDIVSTGNTYDVFRRNYLKQLSEYTGRNTILYYSGWLQKPEIATVLGINDNDKNGFMATVHDLDRTKGLDLILHTPGGDTAATESIIVYLREIFGVNIRAIIPQMAMSGGTMIACCCNKIIMGKQSSLGPIDPQLDGLAAQAVLAEFKKAYDEIKEDESKVPIWQPIIANYSPTFIVECENSIAWSKDIVKQSLSSNMFKDEKNPDGKAQEIADLLASHDITKSHGRHLAPHVCEEWGLKIEMMENDQKLQDLILSIHHCAVLTISNTNAAKLIENQKGKSVIQTFNPISGT